MTADPGASIVATDRAAEPVAPPLLESPAACDALLRAIADGHRHAIDALATDLLGSTDQRARIVAALDALVATGMPLTHDDRSVTANAFVPLDEVAIRRALPGFRVDVAGSVDSTNNALIQRVRAAPGTREPMVLASELQHAGRGRLGRRWVSAPGASLTVSFAFAIDRSLSALAGVTLACGLAACDALDVEGVAVSLKWPNDLVVDGRKLGGILVEAHATGNASTVVIGVGLNVSARADEEPNVGLRAIDLVRCGARPPDRNRIVAALARALAERLDRFARDGFAAFTDEWNARDAYRDRAVVLRSGGGATDGIVHTGIARGIDDRGALLLDVDGVLMHIVNGDLSLRPSAAP